ncbi:MAG TPA: hypothetical protein VFP43_12895 [Mesorhizobium sp.]|nr:hypothetical protein [Mesorhizobium sp.]HET9639059.1 hypothetical protein [Allosphingosinicella sp.]
MADPIDFTGPYLKAERAEDHIHELERIFWSYIRSNEKALSPNRYRDMRKRATPIGHDFPVHTPTILGDALHNLRAALDHAYCILVKANGGTINRYVKFPFTEKGTRQDLEGAVQGHAKDGCGPSDEIIRVIFDEIQPFLQGSGSDLLKLHVLDIADKHLVLLPATARIVFDRVSLRDGGGVSGITITSRKNSPVLIFGAGETLEPERQHKATFTICFGKGQPFEGEPILPVLKGLSRRVRETLDLLEQRANASQ